MTLPKPDLILVEGGTFLMGGREEEAIDREKPVHEVTLRDFYIGKYPVSQELWRAVMGADNNPSRFKGDQHPVEQVSWRDTREFIEKLNQQTGQPYRLLSESEWEYAARGGRRSLGYTYAGSNKLKDIGWYHRNSHGATKPVGLKYPNELGLYDMSGNVYEWVEDHWHDTYEGAPIDGSAWVDLEPGALRVIRGGGWGNRPRLCRAAFRYDYGSSVRNLYVGFRLGLSLQSVG